MPDPLQELLAAGAVPTTSFPPTSRYVGRRRRRVGPGRRRPAGAVPAPPALPARRAVRAALRGARRSRATAATCSRRGTSATPALWWRLADANGVVDPRDAHGPRRPAAADHARPRTSRGRAMADAVRLQLLIGPGVPVPVPREVLDAVQEVKVESGSGDDAERVRAHLPALEPLAAAHAVPAHGRLGIPILRVVIAVTVRGQTTVLMDGVMTHHEVRSDGGPTSTLRRSRART